VVDRKRLGKVIGALARRYGTQKDAAAALQITPVYFWRLLHHRGGASITPGLFNRIAALLEADDRSMRDLLHAVATAETRQQRHAYRTWLRKSWRRIQPGWPRSSVNDSVWFGIERELPRYAQSYIGAFVKKQEARHDATHWNHRVWLAVANALAPLMASRQAGGIEQSWQELDAADERGPYLKAALRAQDLLLRREANLLRRAQQIARKHRERRR